VLSDLNGHLVDMYEAVRDAPAEVARHVAVLGAADSEDHYYQVRDRYNAGRKSPLRAAQFIYLNRACFNGVFRVNREGIFNVPYGFKRQLLLPSENGLTRLGALLAGADLRAESYEAVLNEAERGDFVYLDPPYPPLNGTAFFRHYTKERFDDEDQAAVARTAVALRERGCHVLVSNADLPSIRTLYSGWHISTVTVPRHVAHKASRLVVRELLIVSDEIWEWTHQPL
jgi:DNA adenine methylase